MLEKPSIWPILVLVLLCVLSLQVLSDEKSTYHLVLSGKTCKTWHQTSSCEYSVGTGLKFSIDGIGQPDTGITFMKSSFDGDFYATYELLHGCIVIKRGPKGVESGAIDGPGSFNDYAFVSPRSGNVYKSWQQCKTALSGDVDA
jgi:hypothetical protein